MSDVKSVGEIEVRGRKNLEFTEIAHFAKTRDIYLLDHGHIFSVCFQLAKIKEY